MNKRSVGAVEGKDCIYRTLDALHIDRAKHLTFRPRPHFSPWRSSIGNWPQPMGGRERDQGAGYLRRHERRHVRRRNPREGVRKRPCDRDGRIGKRRRCREPVGGGDVQADRGRHCRAAAAEHDEDQTEGGDAFGQPLAVAAARRRRPLQQGQLEHRVREQRSQHRAGDLRRDVGRERAPRQGAAQAERQGHDGIEVRAGDGREQLNEHEQHGAGRKGVAKKRERGVAAREPLPHDAGADDGGEQERRAQGFGRQSLRKVHPFFARSVAPSMRPISRSFAAKLISSSVRNGSETNSSIRRCSRR